MKTKQKNNKKLKKKNQNEYNKDNEKVEFDE